MDHRLYFVVGDLISNVLVGASAGWCCAMVVTQGWNMFLAMFLAMFIGMLVGTVLFLPLGALFGAMEVMVPTMFGGMISGMVVGMWAAMEPLAGIQSMLIGGACGLAGLVVIWILNSVLRGSRSYSKES